MKPVPLTPAEIETAYRRSSFTLFGHVMFLVLCAVGIWLLRRVLQLPPQTMGVVLLVALVLFSRDIVRWLRCRRAVTELRSRS